MNNKLNPRIQEYVDKCWVINAFTNNKAGGGGAAVCIVPEYPEYEEMQTIASHYSFSETAFLIKKSDHLYQIRWFTPNSEAPMCGHATLAAATVLKGTNKNDNHINKISLISISGNITVIYNQDNTEILLPYKFFPTSINFITPVDKLVENPPLNCFISNNCLFMEFEYIEEIVDMKINRELLQKLPYRALCITSANRKRKEGKTAIPSEIDFISRYFAPKYAIEEDPVCGSAHCTLAPYWAKKLNKNKLIGYQASKQTGIVICEYSDIENNVKLSGETVVIRNPKDIKQ